jgi:DNA-binding winged helix-turn-helix (wHTH) protein
MEICMHDIFNSGSDARYEFGDFTLHAGERRVTHHGKPVHVPSKTFDVLAALLQRAGRLVTKRQLLECVWGDVCVEPGILTVHVAALRKLLGESGGEARFIETVSGYGYRFIADVKQPVAKPGSRRETRLTTSG